MSDKWRKLRDKASGEVVLERVRWCESFWCHFRGLQFVRNLPEDQGLLFVTSRDSIAQAAIHMFFMFIDIAVVWIDSTGTVVDKKLAKKWRPYYAPAKAAQYYVEANVSLLDKVNVGDVLIFDEVADASK
jgi:hypothetical protein